MINDVEIVGQTDASEWGRCKYVRVALRLDIRVSPNPIQTHQSAPQSYQIEFRHLNKCQIPNKRQVVMLIGLHALTKAI